MLHCPLQTLPSRPLWVFPWLLCKELSLAGGLSLARLRWAHPLVPKSCHLLGAELPATLVPKTLFWWGVGSCGQALGSGSLSRSLSRSRKRRRLLGADSLSILFHQRSFQKPDPFSTWVSKEVFWKEGLERLEMEGAPRSFARTWYMEIRPTQLAWVITH